MAIMSDKWIRERSLKDGMIEPFVDGQKRQGTISYGLSSYGYDARVSDDFKIFTNVDSAVVDPKNFAHNSFVDRKGRSEEHTSELQSLMRISYAVFCLKKKKKEHKTTSSALSYNR